MKFNRWARGLSVTGDGTGVVALAGSSAVRLLADRIGLTDRLSDAVSRRGFVPVHDRGQVLVDVATMIAAGGEAISDIDSLRFQDRLFGSVASPPTVWRTLEAITGAGLARIATARARTRRRVWQLLGDGVPASPAAGTDLGDTVVVDIDATLVTAHSEKEQAAPTFKGGFGYHPLAAWCDNTGEMLAVKLRPGNAGANHAGDHIAVLREAIGQIPASRRHHLLVRADTAGATQDLLDWLTEQDRIRGRRVEYSIGFPVHKGIQIHDAIHLVPKQAWQTVLDTTGQARDPDEAGVVELTGLVDLSGWPAGMRLIVRREKPHPGASLTLFESVDGWRYQAFITNTPTGGPNSQLGFLEARHRAHARVEDRIRIAKDSGLGRFPSRDYKINTVWAQIAAITADLTRWLQLLTLADSPDLGHAEPKLLRFRMLHVPAQLARGGRQKRVRLPESWPWTEQITAAFARIAAIPITA